MLWITITCLSKMRLMMKSRSNRYDSQLRTLVELYGIWDAYRTVGETCKLAGFASLVDERRARFVEELHRYAASRYGGGTGASARAMDDVLIERSRITIVGVHECQRRTR